MAGTPCVCGAITVSSGYCCMGGPSELPCESGGPGTGDAISSPDIFIPTADIVVPSAPGLGARSGGGCSLAW